MMLESEVTVRALGGALHKMIPQYVSQSVPHCIVVLYPDYDMERDVGPNVNQVLVKLIWPAR